MTDRNIKQTNKIVLKILVGYSAAIAVLALLSLFGVLHLGTGYAIGMLILGLTLALLPELLLRRLPEQIMKYSMIVSVVLLLSLVGVNARMNIYMYMSYVTAPLLSCLYLDRRFLTRTALLSYTAMLLSLLLRGGLEGMLGLLVGFSVEFGVAVWAMEYLLARVEEQIHAGEEAQTQSKKKDILRLRALFSFGMKANAILHASDTALQGDLPYEVRRSIAMVHSTADDLLTDIHDMGCYPEIEAGKMQLCAGNYEIERLLEELMTMTELRRGADAQIHYYIASELPPILYGDGKRIQQAMCNLVTYASQADTNGRIDIRVRWCKGQDPQKGQLEFVVENAGKDSCSDGMRGIFSMYDSPKDKIDYGLGLCVTRAFVARMGGTIHAASNGELGSYFALCVPQRVGRRAEDASAVPPEARFRTENVRVLIADDNVGNRKMIAEMLGQLGIASDEAENGRIAVEKLSSQPYDLVLMDSFMPIMDGETAICKIRGHERQTYIPILALVADVLYGKKERMLSCGADDYLIKPVSLCALSEMLNHYLPKSEEKS